MRLSELMQQAGLQDARITGDASVVIRDLSTDSRSVKAGALFMAVPGTQHNGAQYIPAALHAGASALLIAERVVLDMPATVPVVRVPSVRLAVAKIAAAFYAPQPEHVLAVTGTDGKTSVADFTRQLCELSGLAAASMGTLGLLSPYADLNDGFAKNNTSPEPVLLHRTLQHLSQRGVQHVAVEASSHGLDQYRLHGVRVEAAAFTNLTRDHLDYHGTIEAYAKAKQLLFTQVLQEGGTAVIHASDSYAPMMMDGLKNKASRIWRYGEQGVELKTVSLQQVAEGLCAEVEIFGVRHHIAVPLYGAFQLQNILAAIGLCAASGLSAQELVAHLPKLVGVKGRLERVATLPNGALCFVDYAHTPAALANILQTLRPHTQGKLTVVFGCGGDRDAGKRAPMGEAASKYADSVIVTDDNPRTEDANKIREAVLSAAPNALEIADRASAIAHAVGQLNGEDTLVVAGKGHENYQIIGTEKLVFDDAETIQNAVRDL